MTRRSPAPIIPPSSALSGASPTLPKKPGKGWFQRTVLASIVGLFGAAAAIGMVKHPDAFDMPATQRVESEMALNQEDIQVSVAGTPVPFISETRIRPGDTLAGVLQRLGLDSPGLQTFLTHDPSARSIYKLYPGRVVQAATDENGALKWMRYIHTPGNEVDGQVVTRMLSVVAEGNGFKASEVTEDTARETRVAVGTIRSSLFGATDAAGVPDSVTLQMAEILNAKIDFLRDLRQGDQFRVVYESRSHDGRYAGAGRVLALEFISQGKTYTAVWFDPDGKHGSYYDFDGSTTKGAFLRTALEFTRISSTFGMRMHPIHGKWVGHMGVDYAAPAGTPIHSVADGTVEFTGWQNGYGNVTIIKHFGKFSTLYGHQSAFASGLRKGEKISQGQLIGYVGQTGWATGPHLHYEFRIDDKPVDPLAVDLPVARPLDPKEAKQFAQVISPYRAQIELLTQLQQAPVAAAQPAQPVASR
jgi:murein DD-endopeptidase MepM/ murein hydrolase activator NlpD